MARHIAFPFYVLCHIFVLSDSSFAVRPYEHTLSFRSDEYDPYWTWPGYNRFMNKSKYASAYIHIYIYIYIPSDASGRF